MTASIRVRWLQLFSRGVVLTTDAGRLRFDAPAGALTDDDKAFIRAHRDAFVALLREHCGACGAPLYTVASLRRGRCVTCHERNNP